MTDSGLLYAVPLFVLGGILGRLFVLGGRHNRDTIPLQLKLFYVAYGARFGLSVLLYQFNLASLIGDFDSSGWYYGASLANTWNSTGVGLLDLPRVWLQSFSGLHVGYYYTLATVFYLTGAASRLPAAVVDCLAGALTVVLAYRVAKLLFSDWVAQRVGWWTCLFPSMIIWSAQTIKEPLVILLEMLALYGCLRLKMSGFSVRHVVLTGLAIVFLMPFRFYAAYIAAAAVVASLALPDIRKGRIAIGPALVIVAVAVPTIIYTGILAQHEAQFERFDVHYIQAFRQNIAEGSGSGVTSDIDMGTTTGFGLATLIGAAHLLLAPFPWQLAVGSVRMILTTPELVFWWWLVFVGIRRGFPYLLRTRGGDILPILVFVFGLGLLYSSMFGNVGLIFRQRAQILPSLFLFAAVGLERRAEEKKARQLARQPAGASSPALHRTV